VQGTSEKTLSLNTSKPKDSAVGVINQVRVKGEDRVLVELMMNKQEYLELQGKIEQLSLISEERCDRPVKYTRRGSGNGSLYFLAPKEIKFLKGLDRTKVQVIERQRSYLAVYRIPKW
jgi:hypothetical protein